MKRRRKRLIATGKVAEYCDVSPETVTNWIKRGFIKACRTPGGHYRIRLEEVEAFLREHGMPVLSNNTSDASRKALIVDDDPLILELLRKALAENWPGWDIRVASSGYDACIVAGSMGPDLVILDIKLGDVDGHEVCRRLKSSSQTAKVKILAISGFVTAENEEAIKKAGADDFLGKPFNMEQLISKTSALIGELDDTPLTGCVGSCTGGSTKNKNSHEANV